MQKFKFGVKVTDVIDGTTGIVTGYCQYQTGCDTYLIEGKRQKDGKKDALWVDEGRLKRVGKTVVNVNIRPRKPAGPQNYTPGVK